MADIELVIKIAEKTYNALTHTEFDANLVVNEMRKSIAHGTPLSKGHGRLCDLDAALKCVDNDSVTDCDAKWQAIGLFEWAMAKRVVIEADKSESEEV